MANLLLKTLTDYLDEYLQLRDVPDESHAVNGLQVENVSGSVNRMVAAVDASLETIRAVGRPDGRAADSREPPTGPALLLVHHGLLWDGNLPVTGRRFQRIRALLEADVALYSAHIPLDVHPQVGNNPVLARQLGLTAPAPFDLYKGVALGVQGSLNPAVPREEFVSRIEGLLGASARLIPGGPAVSHRIGIITGGAGGRIGAAHAAGLDTFVTGEGPHHTYFDAMELGINVVYAGHYATETVGVKALAAHLSERFGLPWEFHHHPTGL